MKRTLISLLLASAAPAAAQDFFGLRAGDLNIAQAIHEQNEALKAAAAVPAAEEKGYVEGLMALSRADLEDLYKISPAGPIPHGDSKGAAALGPGTAWGHIARLKFSLFWQGKVFDAEKGTLVNKLGPLRGFSAKVYKGVSLLDGKESIIIDYSSGSWLVRAIRDEIRLVAPGVYLGFAYEKQADGQPPVANVMFALDFNPKPAR